MTISDETLMAYLDGELPIEERTHIAALVDRDPQLKARLARQERVHAALRAAFDPALKTPLPERLVSVAMTAPVSRRWRVGAAIARVLGGGEANAFPRAMVFAATLLVGIGLGLSLGLWQGGSGLIAPDGDRLVAQGPLAEVLNRGLASESPQSGPRVGVSFRAKSGEICRSFETGSARENFAGVACRMADAWSLATVTRIPPRTGPYELASAGMPPAVRDAVAEMIEGEPFDAAQERRARDQGWRVSP